MPTTDGMVIRIRYLVDGLEEIGAAHEGEWLDLRAAEDCEIKTGEFKKIRLGVAMQLPRGYEAIMAARSSTYQTWGIIMANGIGVVDNAYCGDNDEWHFPAIAVRDTKIAKNDRICQFRILYRQPHCDIFPVETLRNPNRGGFGSSGTN